MSMTIFRDFYIFQRLHQDGTVGIGIQALVRYDGNIPQGPRHGYRMADTLQFVGIDPGLRPEAIPIADYVRLANALE